MIRAMSALMLPGFFSGVTQQCWFAILSESTLVSVKPKLRNTIAHDDAGDNIAETSNLCRQGTPNLPTATRRIDDYFSNVR